MPRTGWMNPATSTYQARRWARRVRDQATAIDTKTRAATQPTPDPGSQTENIRVDPSVPGVAFVTTTVPQPYGGSPLVLYPSTIVRRDQVNANVAWLTVTETGS